MTPAGASPVSAWTFPEMAAHSSLHAHLHSMQDSDPKTLALPPLNNLLGLHTWYSKVVSPWAPSGPRAARRSLSRCRECWRIHRATAKATSSPATPARATRVSSTERMGEVVWAGRGRTAAASSLCGNKARIRERESGVCVRGRVRCCLSPVPLILARTFPGTKLQGHLGSHPPSQSSSDQLKSLCCG